MFYTPLLCYFNILTTALCNNRGGATEKCVDVALALELVSHTSTSTAFDIAIVVTGTLYVVVLVLFL